MKLFKEETKVIVVVDLIDLDTRTIVKSHEFMRIELDDTHLIVGMVDGPDLWRKRIN